MAHYDVLAIGNAIVDVIARTDEDFLVNNGIIKGAMNLIDAKRAELLYSRMGQAVETSGGSARIQPPHLPILAVKLLLWGKWQPIIWGRFLPMIFVDKVLFMIRGLSKVVRRLLVA